jgi:hypothetical protein
MIGSMINHVKDYVKNNVVNDFAITDISYSPDILMKLPLFLQSKDLTG